MSVVAYDKGDTCAYIALEQKTVIALLPHFTSNQPRLTFIRSFVHYYYTLSTN